MLRKADPKPTHMKLCTTQLLGMAALLAGMAAGNAQTTIWTYQGRLNGTTGPAAGNYDFQFAVFNAASGGSQQGATLTNSAVSVTNGLFTVSLDFGAGVFTGPDRWLEIGVRSNGVPVTFTLLSTRQRITPSPYAIYASNAGTATAVGAGAVSASQLNTPGAPGAGQALVYNGSTLVWTNASAAALAWTLNGNAGTTAGANYLGTTDNQPLEVKANATRALRIEPNSAGAPNFIAGGAPNFVQPGIVGAAIGGGGATNYSAGVLGIPSNASNSIRSDFGVVAGGLANSIAVNSKYSVIVSGLGNSVGQNSGGAFIGGGYQNLISSNSIATVLGGGDQNFIMPNSPFATLAGGGVNGIYSNSASATIGGGEYDAIFPFSDHATVSGGHANVISTGSPSSVIVGGSNNIVSASLASIGGGAVNFVDGDFGVVAGGYGNTNLGQGSVIGGGSANRVTANFYATIAGGVGNRATTDYAAIGGGLLNTNGGANATISGGQGNYALGGGAMIPGGSFNQALGDFSFAAGYQAQALHAGAFVWADDSLTPFASTTANQFVVRATGGVGINTNATSGAALTVIGGVRNGPGGTVQSRVQFGTANVGTGTNGVNTFTITFPAAFSTVPKVFVMTKGNDNPDTFAISTRAVSATSFKVNIIRVDTASGWGQALNVDWYATE